ncbi:MAG TPA: ABC transporter permease [Ktedonobacteraceae bacterium]|nr:ABC transporter permease [Ktedonobacteraceae bacterium]
MMPKKAVVTPDREMPSQNSPEQGRTSVVVSTSGAASLHNWRNIRLITGREYKNRITQRSFIIMSILLLIIVFVAAFVPTIMQLVQRLTASPGPQTQVVVVNEAGMIAGMNETMLISDINSELNGTNTGSNAPYTISVQSPTSLDNLQSQVKHGKLDILLVLTRSTQGNLQFIYDTDTDPNNDPNLSNIQTLTQQLNFLDVAYRQGLTPAQIHDLVASPSLTTVYSQQGQNTRSTNQIVAEYILAFAGPLLIYTCISLYINIVASGVAEEKSNRIMEILVNAATPFQLLAGKIIGIGAACLTQMACLVVVGIGALLLQAPLQDALLGANAGGFGQYLTSISIPYYLLFLICILLAFFLYATLAAGLSATIRRQDEVQNAIMLPMILIITGWILVVFSLSSPNATWVKALSYVPLWSPMLILVRVAVGTVAWWEVVVSITLLLVAILACAWFAARLYRVGVLMYGQRPGLGQVMKLAFGR